jgi:hypothetical protein
MDQTTPHPADAARVFGAHKKQGFRYVSITPGEAKELSGLLARLVASCIPARRGRRG